MALGKVLELVHSQPCSIMQTGTPEFGFFFSFEVAAFHAGGYSDYGVVVMLPSV